MCRLQVASLSLLDTEYFGVPEANIISHSEATSKITDIKQPKISISQKQTASTDYTFTIYLHGGPLRKGFVKMEMAPERTKPVWYTD